MKRKLSKLLGVALTIALLTSLLVSAAPAAALGAPSVTLPGLTDGDISKVNAQYNVRFEVGKQLTGNMTAVTAQDSFTITLPAGTVVSNTTFAATITAGPGWITMGTTEYKNAILGAANWSVHNANRTITYTLPANSYIGEGAQVRVEITAGITNPATIGDYALTVATSQETTAVSSNTYSIGAPYVAPLTGIVSLYNSAGVLMNQFTGASCIANAVGNATAGGLVEITNGTYNENITVGTAVTIKAVGDAVNVNGMLTITAAGVDAYGNPINTVIEGLILRPAALGGTVITTTAAANNTIIRNCTISKKVTFVAGTQVANAAGLVILGAGARAANQVATIEGCTFDTTDGAVADTSIVVNDGPVTVTGSTFAIDETAIGGDDTAISVVATGGAVREVVTVEDNTFTGNSGIAYATALGCTTATINGNTFTGVEKAVMLNSANASATITSNTITGGTVAPASVSGTASGVLDIQASETVTIQKNNITDCNGHTLVVGAANARVAFITFNGNVMTGNAFGVVNKNTAATLVAQLNYWGSNTGPTIYTNPGGSGDPVVAASASYGAVTFVPWTNASTSEVKSGTTVANIPLDYSTTTGVSYTSTAAGETVTTMRYTMNPAPIATTSPALDNGYYDIYVPNAAGTITILFFNPNVTTDTKVYYYSALQKEWVICSAQDVAGNGAYAYITVTGATNPTRTELNGTIFALVTETTIPTPPSITFADGGGPTVGATDVSVEPTFTWGAVAGAIRYEIALCEDPSFTIIEWAYNVDDPFYKTTEALRYDTTYYWRVRAVLNEAGEATRWTTGVFTTEAEPVEAAPTVVVEPTKPEVTVEIPATKITVEPSDPVIPTYMLWIIVVVGAVLVIALIVLIVRTRRVA